jgi:hypothetical protein
MALEQEWTRMINDALESFQNANWPAVYREHAKQLGKKPDGLTEDEKRQAIMNHVLTEK